MMALQENQDLEREPEITEQAANSDNGRSDRLSGLSLLSVISWGAVISGFFLIAVAVGFNLSNTITLLGLCLSVIGTGFIAWQSADAFKQRHDEAKEMADAHRRLGSTLKALNIAHQSVAESEGRYRSLVESQTELILRRDTDGEVTFVNDTFLKAMDRSREDLLYQPFNIDGPDGESDFTTTVLNPLAAPPHRRTREVELSTALGARWYQVEDSAVLDGDGTINEIQTVLYDITEAKQHQAMLTDVKAQADRANIEKTGLIAALSQELKHSSKS